MKQPIPCTGGPALPRTTTRFALGVTLCLALTAAGCGRDETDDAEPDDATKPRIDASLCERVSTTDLAAWATQEVAARHPETVAGAVNCDATLANGTEVGWQVRAADRPLADFVSMFTTAARSPATIRLADGTEGLAVRGPDQFDREQVTVAFGTADAHLVLVVVAAGEKDTDLDTRAAERLATRIAAVYVPGIS